MRNPPAGSVVRATLRANNRRVRLCAGRSSSDRRFRESSAGRRAEHYCLSLSERRAALRPAGPLPQRLRRVAGHVRSLKRVRHLSRVGLNVRHRPRVAPISQSPPVLHPEEGTLLRIRRLRGPERRTKLLAFAFTRHRRRYGGVHSQHKFLQADCPLDKKRILRTLQQLRSRFDLAPLTNFA